LISQYNLTVRLLVTSTGRWTTELLWLTTTRIADEQRSVITEEELLDLLLGLFIDVYKGEEEKRRRVKGEKRREEYENIVVVEKHKKSNNAHTHTHTHTHTHKRTRKSCLITTGLSSRKPFGFQF
jgi:hypothetical protein